MNIDSQCALATEQVKTPNRSVFKNNAQKFSLPSFDFGFFEAVDFENSIICLKTNAILKIDHTIGQYLCVTRQPEKLPQIFQMSFRYRDGT